jgi:hypothetical protein
MLTINIFRDTLLAYFRQNKSHFSRFIHNPVSDFSNNRGHRESARQLAMYLNTLSTLALRVWFLEKEPR